MIPDDVLAGLSEAEHQELWASRLPVAPPTFCLVAGSPLVGFVSGGHLGDGPEIYALYVEPSAWRQGVGRGLLAAGLARLRDTGATTAGLWVLRDNTRARAFYEALGWTPTGEHRLEPMHGVDLPVVRYATTLG
jgi:GNAT superfamily N-acetyltransferase